MGDTVLSRFSRRTSGGRWIPEVDGLRFLAIALVLADHVAVMLGLAAHRTVVEAPFGSASLPTGLDPLTTIFRQGAVGVQVFFMVSGRLVSASVPPDRFVPGESRSDPLPGGRRRTAQHIGSDPWAYPELDKWAAWLLHRRDADDSEQRAKTLEHLLPIRDRVLEGAGYGTDVPVISGA